MVRPRTSATQLARLFGATEQPLYVVDEEWTIVFCNPACLAWLERSEEEIVGQPCRYHSGPDGSPVELLLAGLCPPPEVIAGLENRAWVAVGSDRREARFVPLLGAEGRSLGVLAIVDPQPQAEAHVPLPETPTAADLHDLLRRLHQHWGRHYGLDRLLGETPAMRRVRSQVELAATSRASVLVCGPPGTGRQHVAAAIHAAGQGDTPCPFVPLACAVLDAELIQSTIRAMAQGGPAAQATGTLLLNDVDQLPANVQAELACLWMGKVFPLRLIATARATLAELVRRGEFRADLASLLSTVVIELPALAERRDDIPLLAQAFLEQNNARGGRQVSGFSPETLDRLDAHAWPGNLDELAQVVAEAHAHCETPQITPGDLPQRLHLAAEAASHPRRKDEPIVLGKLLAEIERELIARALKRSKGNKARAARLLGMTRPRLYRRMIQLGLE
jgi:transcriptional regulator with PAS, ATPase and Fis domain